MDRRKFLRSSSAIAGGLVGAAALAGGAAAALAGEAAAAPSATLPPRSTVLGSMRLVNDYWIGGHANPGDNKWARATYFSGNLAAYRATGVSRYLRYARRWGQQNGFGLNGGVSTRNADNQCAGQAYYDLFDIDGDPSYLTAINESVRLMTYGTDTSTNDWWWVDALHMAMPAFVRVSRYRGDPAYLDKLEALYRYAKEQISGVGLYDLTDRLWFRDSKYIWPSGSMSVSPNGAKVYWSRGNGWALAAHAKVLSLLPAGDARAPFYAANLRSVADALRVAQRSDGFWNVNLVDPQQWPGPETSGTAFFTFGMAYGVRSGLLDAATYLPVVARAWNGMVATAVRADGYLGYVQGVGQSPDSSQPVTANSTADFGVGAFLLAGSEVAQLST
jgi:unsaturated rhamnogalacturonyl hydrolase